MLRSLRLALLASTIFVVPVKADPIFTPIALAAFSAGASVGLTNAIIGIGFLGSVFSAVGSVALSIGVSYVASLLNRPQQQKPSDGQLESKQTVPSRVWHYGRVKVAGPLAYYASSDGNLYKIVMLSCRQVDAFEAYYLNDELVTLDGSGGVQEEPADGQVFIYPVLGTTDQAAQARFVTEAPGWTTDHRLRGVAYLGVVCEGVEPESFQKSYPSGEPSIAALIRGNRLYDPRKDSTVPGGSGSHRLDNPATWEWSELAGLATLDFLLHPDGYNRPVARIDMASFLEHIALCDEDVPLKAGGTEKRYRIATSVDLTQPRKVVLQRLLEASDATLYPTADGKIAIRGGKWEEPTVTLDDEEGHILQARFTTPDAIDRYNELAIQFLDPALDYVENEGEPWQGPDTDTLVTTPLDLFQIPSHGQARRLAKIRMARDNAEWTADLQTRLIGLNVIGERIVRVKFSELGIDLPFWVEGGVEISPDLTTVALKLRAASEASYDWDPETEEGEPTVVPEEIATDYSLTPPPPALFEGPGSSLLAYWDTPTNNSGYAVQFRADGSTAYTSMTINETRDGAASPAVPALASYFVRTQKVAGLSARGDWSEDYPITLGPTNLLTFPEAFDNAAWSKLNVTVTADAYEAPNHAETADAVLETTTNGLHLISRSMTITAGDPCGFSIYVKGIGRDAGFLDLYAEPAYTAYLRMTFDLDAGTFSLTEVGGAVASEAAMEAVPGGWWRLKLAGILDPTSTSALVYIFPSVSGSGSYAGEVDKGFALWGARLELNPEITAYKPEA